MFLLRECKKWKNDEVQAPLSVCRVRSRVGSWRQETTKHTHEKLAELNVGHTPKEICEESGNLNQAQGSQHCLAAA